MREAAKTEEEDRATQFLKAASTRLEAGSTRMGDTLDGSAFEQTILPNQLRIQPEHGSVVDILESVVQSSDGPLSHKSQEPADLPEMPKLEKRRTSSPLQVGINFYCSYIRIKFNRVECVRVSTLDTPQSLEHCLRQCFQIPEDYFIVLRDEKGCAVPLGPALCAQGSQADDASRFDFVLHVARDDSRAQGAFGPHFQCEGHTRAMPSDASTVLSGTPVPSPHAFASTAAFMSSKILEDEREYWVRLARAGWGSSLDNLKRLSTPSRAALTGKSFSRTPSEDPSSAQTTDMYAGDNALGVAFDTSPAQIDTLFDDWTEEAGVLDASGTTLLTIETLNDRLREELGFVAYVDIRDAILKVCSRFQGETVNVDEGIPRTVFASFWQRLALGACFTVQERDISNIDVIEYSEFELQFRENQSAKEFFWGGHRRDKTSKGKQTKRRKAPKTRWGIIKGPGRLLLRKVGVKFFLHPLATDDMIEAARSNGCTMIDRYRHQYVVSIEVYTLLKRKDGPVGTHLVGDQIMRSSMSLIATGDPPTRSKPTSCRDWLISIIGRSDGERADPIDRFKSHPEAAEAILESIKQDLRSHKRLREHQADFLLYSIVDKAAEQMTPIYNAYGHRLQKLHKRYNEGKLRNVKESVDEVSRVRLEIRELHQWISKMKRIVSHLQNDCKTGELKKGTDVPQNFGADARGQGNMLLFLGHTHDYLVQAGERLLDLDELAKAFEELTERQRSDFMNRVLFVLTISTVVMLPSQFLAGVFGMNFQSGMTLLEKDYGYMVFWIFSLSSILLGSIVALTVICCRGYVYDVCKSLAKCCCSSCMGAKKPRRSNTIRPSVNSTRSSSDTLGPSEPPLVAATEHACQTNA